MYVYDLFTDKFTELSTIEPSADNNIARVADRCFASRYASWPSVLACGAAVYQARILYLAALSNQQPLQQHDDCNNVNLFFCRSNHRPGWLCVRKSAIKESFAAWTMLVWYQRKSWGRGLTTTSLSRDWSN